MSDGAIPPLRDLADETFREIMAELNAAAVPIRLRCAHAELAVTGVLGWKHQPVTYCPRLALPGVADSADIYHEACQKWNAVADVGLTFSQDYDRANIYARSGKIDGASSTLAWSYLPQNVKSTSRLEQLYDDAERWSRAWLLEVILHEVGHAIGLNHSTDKNDLMFAYSAGGRMDKPQAGDVKRLRALGYDAPIVIPPEPPTTPPGVPPTFEGVLVGPGGALYKMTLEPA